MNKRAPGHHHDHSDAHPPGPEATENPDHGDHGDHSRQGHHGHGHHGHGDHVAQFRRLFFIMLVLAVPVVLLSEGFANLIGYEVPTEGPVPRLVTVLGVVMYFWGGRPFLTGARDELKSRSPGMMTLISLGITVAFLSSVGTALGWLGASMDFWWEMALLIVIMLAGHWIEMRSLAQTSSALDELAALLPDEAEKLVDDTVVPVPPHELLTGDVVLVRPGGVVPADGRIVSGEAALDESMITGESRAVRRGEGDDVVAGTVSTDSGIRVEVTATGEDTTLAGIRSLVEQAQSSSTKAQRLADRASGWLFWFALAAAIVAGVVWWIVGGPAPALTRVITVLIIACPHALGLAIPLVVSIATGRAAKAGILVTDRMALETMRDVDTVLFDKTGTLTVGQPTLLDVAPAPGYDTEDVLALAAAAEQASEHPLARAIVAAAASRGLRVPAATDFRSRPAEGVAAVVDKREVAVGGPLLLDGRDLAPLDETRPWADEGATVLHVVVDGDVAAALKIADDVRDESAQAVAALHARGIEVAMITGDAQPVAESVARELGIDRVFAGVRPGDKAAEVAKLQDEGKRVAMVGDGVNDAPALAQADVGLAIGAGTDVAVASAGVVLAGNDPRAVLSVIELSRAAYRKMVQNLWWAAGYNIIAVPLAAGVLAPVGFVMPMSVGAILMSASTVIVALNAQTLRRVDLDPATVSAKTAN